MGLDVGVVKIEYISYPKGVVEEFLRELASDPYPDTWGGGWESNSMIEWYKRSILKKAGRYAKRHKLSEGATKEILD